MLIGVAVAQGAGLTWSAATRGHDRGVTPWALLPAGAVMGWVGPRGAVAGVIVFALILLGLALLRREHRTPASATRGGVVAVAAALGAGAALITAFATGAPVGF
jgi:hypothetical protein